ncbi:hypothetical protein TGP89_315127 [Toxoplasma gondii p89]|uniref:Uncharacterized protein n=1 Tax=Toxoplasma gondii p89 TaxID=943119 RepID=A0A086KYY5_TOXGO|nr:hypothetical protein TGP89_315127 [Toxoplasma gondii p89]
MKAPLHSLDPVVTGSRLHSSRLPSASPSLVFPHCYLPSATVSRCASPLRLCASPLRHNSSKYVCTFSSDISTFASPSHPTCVSFSPLGESSPLLSAAEPLHLPIPSSPLSPSSSLPSSSFPSSALPPSLASSFPSSYSPSRAFVRPSSSGRMPSRQASTVASTAALAGHPSSNAVRPAAADRMHLLRPLSHFNSITGGGNADENRAETNGQAKMQSLSRQPLRGRACDETQGEQSGVQTPRGGASEGIVPPHVHATGEEKETEEDERVSRQAERNKPPRGDDQRTARTETAPVVRKDSEADPRRGKREKTEEKKEKKSAALPRVGSEGKGEGGKQTSQETQAKGKVREPESRGRDFHFNPSVCVEDERPEMSIPLSEDGILSGVSRHPNDVSPESPRASLSSFPRDGTREKRTNRQSLFSSSLSFLSMLGGSSARAPPTVALANDDASPETAKSNAEREKRVKLSNGNERTAVRPSRLEPQRWGADLRQRLAKSAERQGTNEAEAAAPDACRFVLPQSRCSPPPVHYPAERRGETAATRQNGEDSKAAEQTLRQRRRHARAGSCFRGTGASEGRKTGLETDTLSSPFPSPSSSPSTSRFSRQDALFAPCCVDLRALKEATGSLRDLEEETALVANPLPRQLPSGTRGKSEVQGAHSCRAGTSSQPTRSLRGVERDVLQVNKSEINRAIKRKKKGENEREKENERVKGNEREKENEMEREEKREKKTGEKKRQATTAFKIEDIRDVETANTTSESGDVKIEATGETTREAKSDGLRGVTLEQMRGKEERPFFLEPPEGRQILREAKDQTEESKSRPVEEDQRKEEGDGNFSKRDKHGCSELPSLLELSPKSRRTVKSEMRKWLREKKKERGREENARPENAGETCKKPRQLTEEGQHKQEILRILDEETRDMTSKELAVFYRQKIGEMCEA